MTRTFESGPARRVATLIAAGFVGPSGSGKTKSMLRFGDGMRRVKPGKTFVVDTNLQRSLHHAPKPGEPPTPGVNHDFEVVHLTAPFSPDDFGQAFDHCVKRGAARIIVDSMSDEWEGQGGVLDWHEVEVERMSGGDWQKAKRVSDTAWIKPKAAHRSLRLWMWQQPVDWLLGYRAKKKVDRKARNAKGRGGAKPDEDEDASRVDLGWQPIGADDIVFDLLFKCLLPPQGDGRPVWSTNSGRVLTEAEQLLIKQPGWFREAFAAHPQIDEELGEKIARWAAGGDVTASPTATSSRSTSAPAGLVERFDACRTPEAFEELKAEMKAAWDSIPKGEARTRVTRAFKWAEERIEAAMSAGKEAAPT